MSLPQIESFSSEKSLVSTILTDPPTYRWFSFFITHHSIFALLPAFAENKELYKKLSKENLKQGFLNLLLLVVLVAGTTLRQPLLYGLSLFFLYPNWKISRSKKQLVAAISMKIISHDFPEPLLQKNTLYQICEKYSKEYGIPSLVDKIYIQEKVLRHTVLFTLFSLLFLFPSPSLLVFILIFFIVYFLVLFFINSRFFYIIAK